MRKLFLALTGIALLSISAQAQKVYDFVSVEKQPMYPGGIANFYKYLGGEIKYPAQAVKDKTAGKVFVSFIVEKDGKLTDVEITRGLSKETDAEAKRVLEKSPKWNPGLIDGKPVRVKYNINVNFNLNNNGADQKANLTKPMNRYPEYPGGQTKMYAYLAKNLKYPAKAKKDGIEGKVYLSFNVQKDGTLTDIEVMKGLSKETDNEALRVLKSTPRWDPGLNDGRPVTTKYQMAINFTLS
ncbi:energy transducer TonB [Pedobacter sp. N23S346]|uniref:energy transducer TonB n=1 Tax=Pedobacter sp. N23S346 TaxID=3402750 RepID=UPI003AD17D6E